MKILTVVGARPQFVKAACLSRELAKRGIKEILVHTGQHFDKNMSQIFFEQMKIRKPDYFLGINGLSHGAMTGQMLEKVEEIIVKEKPDFTLVYGDTNSTFAGALAAKKLHNKLVHVEAGLRSFNMSMPEEINRILTDRISDILFCPTPIAIRNLEAEGFENFGCQIHMSGDIMEDAAKYYAPISNQPFEINTPFVLATIHREENTRNKDRLQSIFLALSEISKNINVIIPVHPGTKAHMEKYGINTKGLLMIDPLGYLEMLWLIQNSSVILTDSGGLQKEAYFFNKYCITLREETEWLELVDNGYNGLSGTSTEKIVELFFTFSNKEFIKKGHLYGGGNAAKNIVDILSAQ